MSHTPKVTQGSRSCLFAKSVITLLALTATSACTPSSISSDSVFQAYNTSGTVEVPPYTRSIFSSTNF